MAAVLDRLRTSQIQQANRTGAGSRSSSGQRFTGVVRNSLAEERKDPTGHDDNEGDDQVQPGMIAAGGAQGEGQVAAKQSG